MEDRPSCRDVALTAHADLVASGKYSFRSFVQEFDRCLARHAPPPSRSAPGRAAFTVRRALRHGQSFVPVRDGYLVLPLHGSFVSHLLRRLPLGPVRPGPFAGRFLRNPVGFIRKGAAITRMYLGSRAVRALLLARGRDEVLRGKVPLWQLLEDLLKLDVARRSISGAVRSPLPFHVDPSIDPADGTLLLTSSPGAAASSRLPPGLEESIRLGDVRQVVWDHSELALEVTFATGRSGWMTLSLGSGGIHRFAALSTFCREAPRLIAGPLASILEPDSPPVPSR